MSTYICKKCITGNCVLNTINGVGVPITCPYLMDGGSNWKHVDNDVTALMEAIDDNAAVAQYLDEAGYVVVER